MKATQKAMLNFNYLFPFHKRDPYYIETSPLIYRANQRTCCSMIGTSFKDLDLLSAANIYDK